MKKYKFAAALAMAMVLGMTSAAMAAPSNFSVSADELDYNLKTGDGEAKGNVVIVQDGGRATANHAKFNSNTKSGTLTGNVVADREDAHIVCNEFVAHNENDLSAIGGAVLTKEGKSLSADRVDYYKVRQYAETIGSWARLTDTDGSVLNAAKIDYDMASGTANAYGGVDIRSDARNLTAQADSALYKTDQDGYVELNGHATATQNGNTVSGDKLRLTNANVAVIDGNANIHYIPEQQPATLNKETEVTEVATASEDTMTEDKATTTIA